MRVLGRSRSRRAGVASTVAAAAVLLLVMLMPESSASTVRSSAEVAVPQGVGAAALKDATVFGPVSPSTASRDRTSAPSRAISRTSES